MAKLSAGLLLFRHAPEFELEVMIAHMGGPFWAKKDVGGWSIVKGEYQEGDDPLEAARREFVEELGLEVPSGDIIDLGEIRQPSGKRLRVWALGADLDVSEIRSNTFQLEWPPRSGLFQDFPEVDRAEWFELATARSKLVKGQVPFIDRLIERIDSLAVSPPSRGHKPPAPQATLF